MGIKYVEGMDPRIVAALDTGTHLVEAMDRRDRLALDLDATLKSVVQRYGMLSPELPDYLEAERRKRLTGEGVRVLHIDDAYQVELSSSVGPVKVEYIALDASCYWWLSGLPGLSMGGLLRRLRPSQVAKLVEGIAVAANRRHAEMEAAR